MGTQDVIVRYAVIYKLLVGKRWNLDLQPRFLNERDLERTSYLVEFNLKRKLSKLSSMISISCTQS